MLDDWLLAVLIFLAAVLYSSVGHAGASGYLAAMALWGIAPETMKPAALLLNVLVASVGTVRFWSAGAGNWRVLWPFAAGSAPLAFAGGYMTLPASVYTPLVGLVLLYAAWRMAWTARSFDDSAARPPRLPAALGLGAALGLLSGLTGVGGGIFLSPLLLIFKWCRTRESAGVAVAFILVNSLTGLAGQVAADAVHHQTGVIGALSKLPPEIWWWGGAAALGGLIGSQLGARRLSPTWLRYVLAVVLVVAGGKMVWTGASRALAQPAHQQPADPEITPRPEAPPS